MEQTNSTDGPEVLRESVADIALKSYTLYFLVMAILLGVLLLAAIRKTAKICCWRCMYGSKYARYEKEDPRVPATLFRTPSILTTLQDHYDKGRSLRSTAKSEATSRSFVSAQDIESAIGTENARVGLYLDAEDANPDGASLDRADVASEFSRAATILENEGNASGTADDGDPERADEHTSDYDLKADVGDGQEEGNEQEVRDYETSDDPDTEKRDTNARGREGIDGEKGTVKADGMYEAGAEDLDTKVLGTESDDGETGSDDDDGTDTSTKERFREEHSEESPINAHTPTGDTEGTEETAKAGSEVNDHNDNNNEGTSTGTDCSFYVSEITIEEDTVTPESRTDPDIELQDMANPDSPRTGRHQSISEESLGSTVSDSVPLVSRQTPPPSESSRRGRYRKNTGQKIISGSSARSTSAKLSKRVNKQI